jgi:hypothetical protein
MHVVTGCSASHRGTGTLALCGEPGTGKSLSFVRPMIIASAIQTSAQLVGLPDIAHVTFDTRRLEVQGFFTHATEPEYRVSAYCLFSACVGFRVLDEGDLLEFWDLGARPSGWLWRIEAGGWLEQEMKRDGFSTSRSNGPNWPAPKEFLVVGEEYCVSVLSHREPVVWVAEPFTGVLA